MSEIQRLPPEQVRVEHEPATPRYSRATQKIRYVLRVGSLVGTRMEIEDGNPLELAIWVPAPSGSGCGLYPCWRVWSHEGQSALAIMFTFYDGTEKSPCIKSTNSARDFAKKNDFEVTQL